MTKRWNRTAARMSALFAAGTLSFAFAACRRATPAPSSGATSGKETPGLTLASAPRLPEDPALGKRAERQWREHLDREERERQLGFDRRYTADHRAIIVLADSCRQRYERATTTAELDRARSASAECAAEMQRRVKAIDPWGTNSRLLPEYASLEAALSESYAAAKLMSLRGDPGALEKERRAFDEHLEILSERLEEANEADED